jgi:hypothetical protein
MIRNFEYVKAFRQGEILIFKLPRKNPSFSCYGLNVVPNNVIREGEKTGHEHKVEGAGQLSLFSNKEDGVIEVGKEGATITHPEHGDVKLDEGSYVVKTQKEAKGKYGSQGVKD